MGKHNVTPEALNLLIGAFDDDGDISHEPNEAKTKSSKKTKDTKKFVYLPMAVWGECNDYKDAFTKQLLKVLRRTRIEDGSTTHTLAYVKNTEDGEPWLRLAWYEDKDGNLRPDSTYVKANKALGDWIKQILDPIFAELRCNLKDKKTLTADQFQAMITGKLPVYFLKRHDFRVLRDGSQYKIESNCKSIFDYYVIDLLLNSSVVEEIKYITNDELQKDNALHYYNIKPSKEHFTQAPCLSDYSPAWARFLKGRFNNPNMDLLRLTHYIYGLMCADYHSRQALILFSSGNSGKTVLATALEAILPRIVQTKLRLKELCSEFVPPQLDGCRGLILDEGDELQKFFDGGFFKRITGAPDDNTCDYYNRKFKDPLPMRIGSVRFMILTNSRLCIHDQAGLTRISPMFFKGNFGRLRDSKDIIDELAPEGEQFIQFCIDNEDYYRSVTSKTNHWYCPLIESNGNINILTDKQYDDWYNENSDELYFSEEEQQCSKMRQRLVDITNENCSAVTTDPDTGSAYAFGFSRGDIASNAMKDLMDGLFIADSNEYATSEQLAQYILKQLKDPHSAYGDKFREIGFKYKPDLIADNITKTGAWKRFIHNLMMNFSITDIERKKINGRRLNILKGIRFVDGRLNEPLNELER